MVSDRPGTNDSGDEQPRTDADDRDEQPATQTRRSLLSTMTAAGAVAGLAGCSDLLSEEARSFAATPAVVHPTGQELFGLPEFDLDEQTRTVSPSDAVGEVELTSYLAVHGRSREVEASRPARFGVSDVAARAVGVLAMPSPEVLGEQLNPLASAPFGELLVGDRGRQLLSRTDAVDAPDFEWVRTPTRVGSEDVELLGSGTTAESYLGVVAAAEDRTTVLTNVARVQRGEDVVIVGEFVWRRTPQEPLDLEGECVDEFCQLPVPTLEGLLEKFRTGIGYVDICDGLAGTGGTSTDVCDPVPDFPPPPPKLGITNARLVQVVEDTVVKQSGQPPTYTEGDSELVKGDNTALVFEFDTLDHLDQMSGPLEVEVYSGDPSSGSTYELEGSIEFSKSHLQAIDNGEHTISVLHRISNGGGPNGYPVFELDTGLVKLSPKPTASQSGWDTAGVSHTHVYGAGSNDIREVEPLKVGFIALRDSPPGFKDPGDRYGDANGRVRDRVRSFRSSIEYLHRAYPGDLVAYLHTDDTTPGGTGNLGIGPVKKDMKRANNNLQNIATGGLLGSSSFPHGGTLHVYGADRSTAIQDIENNGFDVTVAIVPGIATNNSNASDYYDYHGKSASGLAFWGGGKAVSTEGASTSGIDQRISTTVPQEIGHYFQDDYKDPSGHPMAQRRADSDNPFQINVNGKPIDPDHARNQGSNRVSGGDAPGVVSTAYDLYPPPASSLEGFANVQHFENPGGSFSVDGPGWNGTPKTSITKVPSYMSYTGDDAQAWADARIHQQLIEAGSSGWPVRGGTGSSGARYMLSASGEVDDDGAIRYDEVTAFRGVDQYTDGDENPVLVELLGPGEEVLERARVPVRVRPSHGHAAQDEGPVRLPSFLLPFDEDGVAVRTTFEGQSAVMNPVERSIRDAVDRVPERGFAGDPAAARAAIGEALDEVADRMAEGAYDEAAALVDGPVRERIREAVVEYEAGLDGRSPEALLDLVDRMVTRLE